jgi:hypothetical protein
MTKKIAIIGRHPTLEPGFNGGMSLNEALGFEALGCTVTLFLPTSEVHNPANLLAKHSIMDFDELPRFGGQFDVRPYTGPHDLRKFDVLIWQCYRPQEAPILVSLRKLDIFKTKSPPRLFTGSRDRDFRKARGMTREFDLVAASLKADVEVARESFGRLAERFSYVPRGFNPSWLNGEARDKVPTIGLDRAVKVEDRGVRASRHIVEVGVRLREKLADIRFLSMRAKIKELDSEPIPALPLLNFYDRFINRLWIYFPIDFEFSGHRQDNLVTGPHGRRMYIGLYENQIVETQLAGGLVIARKDDIPEELIFLPEESLVDDYTDIDAMVSKAMSHIENFEERSKKVRQIAIERHSHLVMTKTWLEEIERLGS